MSLKTIRKFIKKLLDRNVKPGLFKLKRNCTLGPQVMFYFEILAVALI